MSHINSADVQYLNLVNEILAQSSFEPTRAKYPSNGQTARAKKVFGKLMTFNLSEGIPILTTKEVKWKAAIKEILWIYVMGSNKVSDLGSGIWDQWVKPDGTIGPAYGFQARHWPNRHHHEYLNHVGEEIDQVAILLDKLKNNPQDRGMIISLWNVADLPYMALRPCAFQTMWDVSADGHLNCTLIQRSGDVPVGVPFNTLQYAVLTHMFAHVSNLVPGTLNHYINNAHIYENQVGPISTQLNRQSYKAPRLWINPSVRSFNDLRFSDFHLDDYEHAPFIDMGEVAE